MIKIISIIFIFLISVATCYADTQNEVAVAIQNPLFTPANLKRIQIISESFADCKKGDGSNWTATRKGLKKTLGKLFLNERLNN